MLPVLQERHPRMLQSGAGVQFFSENHWFPRSRERPLAAFSELPGASARLLQVPAAPPPPSFRRTARRSAIAHHSKIKALPGAFDPWYRQCSQETCSSPIALGALAPLAHRFVFIRRFVGSRDAFAPPMVPAAGPPSCSSGWSGGASRALRRLFRGAGIRGRPRRRRPRRRRRHQPVRAGPPPCTSARSMDCIKIKSGPTVC